MFSRAHRRLHRRSHGAGRTGCSGLDCRRGRTGVETDRRGDSQGDEQASKAHRDTADFSEPSSPPNRVKTRPDAPAAWSEVNRPAARRRSPCRRSAAAGRDELHRALKLGDGLQRRGDGVGEPGVRRARFRPCSVIASCSPSRVTTSRTRPSSGWRLAISATCSGCTNMPLTLVVWSARPIQPLMRMLVRPQGERRAAPRTGRRSRAGSSGSRD